MNTEERLRDHLSAIADRAEVRFNAQDVRERAATDQPSTHRTWVRPLLGVAAGAALVVGVGVGLGRSPRSEISTGTADTSSGINPTQLPGPTTVPEPTNDYLTLGLVELDQDAVRLAPGAVVIGGEGMGQVEVGAPSAEILAEAPQLEGGQCVATVTSVACSRTLDSGRSTGFVSNDQNRPTGSANGSDGILLLFEQEGQIVVSGLPDEATRVTFETDPAVDGGRYQLTPVAGTAPFPRTAEASWFLVRAHNATGAVIYDSGVFELPAPVTPFCGAVIPADFEVTDATEPSFERFVTSGGTLVELHQPAIGPAVELRWPPRPRPLYDLDAALGAFFFPDIDAGGPSVTMESFTMTMVDSDRNPLGRAVRLVRDDPDPAEPKAGCEFVELTVTDDGRELTSFGVDLTASSQDWPLTDLSPRITSTEAVASIPPSRIAACDNAEVPNVSDQQVQPSLFATPAEAFNAFMNTDAAWTFIDSGWHEMVADGVVAYGMPYDWLPGGPTSQTRMVTVITVTQADGGWGVTDWTASGC